MKSDRKPDVCVVGLGYIGLPTAAVIARSGCTVRGVDVSETVVDTINRGEIHIEEVDLDGLVQGVVARGLLSAATQVAPADVFVIAVPTPFGDDHAPDISYVLSAARAVAPVLKPGDIIILESTSPVGTTEAMRDLIAEQYNAPTLQVAQTIVCNILPPRITTVLELPMGSYGIIWTISGLTYRAAPLSWHRVFMPPNDRPLDLGLSGVGKPLSEIL